jgi:hypothetical protein
MTFTDHFLCVLQERSHSCASGKAVHVHLPAQMSDLGICVRTLERNASPAHSAIASLCAATTWLNTWSGTTQRGRHTLLLQCKCFNTLSHWNKICVLHFYASKLSMDLKQCDKTGAQRLVLWMSQWMHKTDEKLCFGDEKTLCFGDETWRCLSCVGDLSLINLLWKVKHSCHKILFLKKFNFFNKKLAAYVLCFCFQMSVLCLNFIAPCTIFVHKFACSPHSNF